MADQNHEELLNLRSLVVRLSKEIDYKNYLLMQKEGLTLEKFAAMASLLEEKDRLLGERSDVIGALMAQKHRLNEAFIEGTRNLEHMKLELRKVTHDLEVEKHKHYLPSKKKVEYKAETKKRLPVMTTTCPSNGRCLKSPKMELVVLDNSHDEHNGKLKSLIVQDGELERQYLEVYAEELKLQNDSLKKELELKGKELRQIESLNQNLLSKEHSSNEELQAARREAIKCFHTMDITATQIGIKRLGEIDPQPFRDVCSKKPCNRKRMDFNKLYSSWQVKVGDPSWKPFKKQLNNEKEVIDDNDVKLRVLRKELGDEAYKAVTNALIHLNEYNPDSRHPIPELWNFEEGRRAILKEVIQFIIEQWKGHRDKDNEQSAVITEIMFDNERLQKQLASVNLLLGEKDKLLNDKYAAIGKLMSEIAEKDKLLGELSATIGTIKIEKRVLPNNGLQSKEQQLESHTKQQQEKLGNDYRGKQIMAIKVEGVVDHIVSSINIVEPFPRNFKNSMTQKVCEQK